MRTITLSTEPAGEAYRDLVRAIAPLASEFRFVTMDRWPTPDAAAGRIRSLDRWLIASDQVDEWPGTQLKSASSAHVWRYRVDDLSIQSLLQQSMGFQDWGGELPLDLHFVREDGSTVLGSTSSEEDVWLCLLDDEVRALAARPRVKALLDDARE
jgi:hypothetical protein